MARQPKNLVEKRVTDMYVNCSLPMRPDAIAASDTCQKPANSATLDTNNAWMYRCETHKSIRSDGTWGETSDTVMRRSYV